MNNDELIARLAATGPDRELDLAIAHVFFSERAAWAAGWSHSLKQQRGGKAVVPAFTASNDAAQTLVPDGMRRRTIVYEDGRAGVQLWRHTDRLPAAWGAAYASEPIATVIAALKAKEADNG
jgi:hypothetical protein